MSEYETVKEGQGQIYPKAGAAAVALLLAFAINLVLSIFLLIAMMATSGSIPTAEELLGSSAIYSPIFLTISGVISFGIWPFVLLRSRGEKFKPVLRLNFAPRHLLIGLMAGVAIFFLALGLDLLLSRFIAPDPITELINEATTEAIIANYGGWRFLLGVLTMGVVTGFCEEIFFRGFVMRGFENSLHSQGVAIFLTSLIFSVLHMRLIAIVPIFILAMVMGFLVIRTDSTYTAITCHATYNSLILAAAVFW